MPLSTERKYILPDSQSECLVSHSNSQPSSLGVIVTHPWGMLGGNMHNNVVRSICKWFQQLGITTLRFDFAGTQLGRGYTQVNQVIEASNFLLNGTYLSGDGNNNSNNVRYILLVGYSYGSIICGSASSQIPQCIGLIEVSPPFSVRHWLYCFNGNYHIEQSKIRVELPKLFVIGSNDNFTSEQIFLDIVNSMPILPTSASNDNSTTTTTTGAVLKDVDHFYNGGRSEKDLLNVIGHWILKTYPQCSNNLQNLCTIIEF